MTVLVRYCLMSIESIVTLAKIMLCHFSVQQHDSDKILIWSALGCPSFRDYCTKIIMYLLMCLLTDM